MKITAIVFNFIALGLIIFFFIDEMSYLDVDELLPFVVFFLAPLFSLIAILKGGGENALSLYFKRKALEEKSKIKKLSDEER